MSIAADPRLSTSHVTPPRGVVSVFIVSFEMVRLFDMFFINFSYDPKLSDLISLMTDVCDHRLTLM